MEDDSWFSSRTPLTSSHTDEHFTSDSLPDKLVRAIAQESFLPVKEVLECGELFARIRKNSRAPFVADLCCGHGLLGILFAAFEKKVERVVLVDSVEPESLQKLLQCSAGVAPWITGKIETRQEKIHPGAEWIEPGMSVVSAHACGTLSDLCIDLAIESKGPLAILPCCYPKRFCPAPDPIQKEVGFETAYDIDRTYRLEAAGYRTHWAVIPEAITPMNRAVYGIAEATSAS